MDKAKPLDIPKALVWKAYQLVKANKGSAGIDRESIADFDLDLTGNLYKLWNRLSSGTYFPPAVKGVEIPKKQGGTRLLGVPTVSDRIAQMTIKLAFEPYVEPKFLADSYGYRPNKSALDAVGVTRQRCWKYDWLLEFDIRGLFDNIDHEMLMKAVKLHTSNKWILLYIERWLKASVQMPDGSIVRRTSGSPQGGVISPILSNLFLHYVFDVWMTTHHKDKPWCRYADDGIVHCKSEAEAQAVLVELKQRFAECKLEIHPDKTKIVYCKDGRRTGDYEHTEFKFLGYEFRKRKVKSKIGRISLGFTPAICKEAKKDINARIRRLDIRNRTDMNIDAIANWINPLLNGWINYYGKYTKSSMYSIFRNLDQTLKAWAMRKYKKMRNKKTQAGLFIDRLAEKRLHLFAHWRYMHKVV